MTSYWGVDFHTRQQLSKWCDTQDGEIKEQRLFHHSLDEVRQFYAQLRMGKSKALVAVAHSLLVIVYHVLAQRADYRELGGDYF